MESPDTGDGQRAFFPGPLGPQPYRPGLRFSSRALLPMGVVVLALALLGAGLVWINSGRPAVVRRVQPRPAQAVVDLPATPADIERHAPEPVSQLPRDAARRANRAVAFATDPLPAARPFVFSGSAEDRVRARECLATAALYEAGADPAGETAVMQVVLNRVRHPAFPATVCGAVYQGSERSTGCQFSFTCDGSLRRAIPERFRVAARVLADRALGGRVDAHVGLATHYHTDWVYPYWSPSLTKLARVETHLFFARPGYWGRRAGYARRYTGGEPDAPSVTPMPTPVATAGTPTAGAAVTPVGVLPVARDDSPLPAGLTRAALAGARLRIVHPDGGAFGLLVAPETSGQQMISIALRLCTGAAYCHVSAWADQASIPPGFPIPPAARARTVFDYIHDSRDGQDQLIFDCKRFPRPEVRQCR